MSNLGRSKKRSGGWFAVPAYPFLFSAYPVLALLAQNAGQVKWQAVWRPLLISLMLAGFLFGLWSLLLRDRDRAAFLSTLWLGLIFFYGHVHILLTAQWQAFNIIPWLLGGWLVLAVLTMIWALKRPPAPETLNVIVIGLVLMLLWQIGSKSQLRGSLRLGAENAPVQALTRPQAPPDIYYFILDMYTRADLLKQDYGFDNREFLQALQDRGFYIAACSQSNYTRTELSVTSSLNMSYLQELDPRFANPVGNERRLLWDALKHSAVRHNLEQLGYQTVSFATGFAWSELDDADRFLAPPPLASGMTEFETLFLKTTLARIGYDFGWLNLDRVVGQNYRDRHTLVFNSMESIAQLAGPQFVYVHLIMPHPPFVFGPHGEPLDPTEFLNEEKKYPASKFKAGYIDQVTFLNRKLLEMIDTILAESETPPIILLQGDHGPWAQPNPQHFYILNAYYLPGYTGELYPQISPVNSFRLIFNNYFDGNYDMLPDITYYSPVPQLFDFSEVRNPCH